MDAANGIGDTVAPDNNVEPVPTIGGRSSPSPGVQNVACAAITIQQLPYWRWILCQIETRARVEAPTDPL